MKLIVGNSRTEEMSGDLTRLDPKARLTGAWAAQRMLWFAEDDDVLVLPWRPPPAYLDYVTRTIGTDAATLTIVVPPGGELGTDLLTPDRLAERGFRRDLAQVLHGRDVHRILSAFDDHTITGLADALGAEAALPGHAFSSQGGVALANSKAVFRALAAAAGIRTAPGVVTTNRHRVVEAVAELLAAGHPAMLKQETATGSRGNLVLSPYPMADAPGAWETVVLDEEGATTLVADRWNWLSGGGGHRVVVERYFAGSVTVYAEFDVQDDASHLSGTGRILMDPTPIGEVVPAPDLSADTYAELVDEGRRLCDIFRGLGYRGFMSADAILTDGGELYFTETNGRVTGSTHLHTVIAARMLTHEQRSDRVIVERAAWAVPSYEAAVAGLERSELAFDRTDGTGIAITANYVPMSGTVMYAAVAETLEAADELAARLVTIGFDRD